MVCADCGVFATSPVCGACRALKRISGLLRSGHLKGEQERRVAEIIRGAAGELTDLVEENLPKGRADLPPPGQEATPGLTSGPLEAPAAKKGEKGDSDYTEESSEEEVAVEEAAVEPEATTVKAEAGEEDTTQRETAEAGGSWGYRCSWRRRPLGGRVGGSRGLGTAASPKGFKQR